MKNIHINKRLAYTEQELILLINKKKDELGLRLYDLYNLYKKYFTSEKELEDWFEGRIDTCKDFFYFINDFLGISIEKSTEIISDKDIISARGELKSPEEANFIDMINLFFDTMIKCERMSNPFYLGSKDYNSGKSLIDADNSCKVKFVKEKLNIDSFTNPEVLNGMEGYFIIEFPNKLNISGITIIKETRDNDYKHICIYINSNEPKGRRHFTYAHELYHVFFESSLQNISYYDTKDPIEKKADEFANEIIFEREKFIDILIDYNFSHLSKLKFEDIIEIQEEFKSSFIAVLTAISKIRETETNKHIMKKIPQIDPSYYKYRHHKNWEELVKKSEGYTDLNNYDNRYYTSPRFFCNLKNCYENKLIDLEEYRTFMNFFDINI